MDKKLLLLFGWLFGGFFILFGVSFVVNLRMFPYNFAGVIFIVVGLQFIIKNRKMIWMKKGYIDTNSNTAIRESGEKGEKEVAYALSWLDKEKDFIVVNNITLQGSYANSFTKDVPLSKEIRSGFVAPDLWIIDPSKGLKIFEESMLNSKFGVIVTFIKVVR
jgi:hypothetical protein